MRSSGGARFSSGGRNFGSSGSGRSVNSGSLNNNGARFSGNVMRPGNVGGRTIEAPRFVEGGDRAASSRFRGRPPSGNFVMGNSPPPRVTAPTQSHSNLPGSAFGSSRFQRSPGAITHGNGNFASSNRDFGDRHFSTPHVPGLPASGGRFNNFPNHSPGFGHRSPRFWYGNRPFWGWNGGYWHGVYWPRAYYRPGFVGFVTLLPPVYSTFWYGGVSYYYANDLYYTWSPDRYGYVVSNPPPVAEDSSGTYSTAPDEADQGTGPGDIYVYPRNGQSEEQTAQDRYECHQWAVNQTGFDPTLGQTQASSAGSAEDYRRAIIACLDGRGYSAN
jgi:hypothetical protein